MLKLFEFKNSLKAVHTYVIIDGVMKRQSDFMKIKLKDKINYFLLLLMASFLPTTVFAEEEVVEATCENLLGPEIIKYLTSALTIIQVAGVLLAIILGMVDFLGALWSGEADANTKAFKKLKIRIAMAAVLLIVPAILKFVFSMFGMDGNSFCVL